jgi:hypothetical protein
MTPADWIQLGSLIVAGVGLTYLVKYVGYTKEIALQAGLQTEATFKPAIVAIHGGSTDEPPGLRNIGKGPAVDVDWSISDTDRKGKISYLEPCHETRLPVKGAMSLYVAATKSGRDTVRITCRYKSVSGKQHGSVSTCDFDRGRFSTLFEG